MSKIERNRIRKEAADAVTSRPPRASDARTESALRRDLGIAMFDTLRARRKEAATRPQPLSDEEKTTGR